MRVTCSAVTENFWTTSTRLVKLQRGRGQWVRQPTLSGGFIDFFFFLNYRMYHLCSFLALLFPGECRDSPPRRKHRWLKMPQMSRSRPRKDKRPCRNGTRKMTRTELMNEYPFMGPTGSGWENPPRHRYIVPRDAKTSPSTPCARYHNDSPPSGRVRTQCYESKYRPSGRKV